VSRFETGQHCFLAPSSVEGRGQNSTYRVQDSNLVASSANATQHARAWRRSVSVAVALRRTSQCWSEFQRPRSIDSSPNFLSGIEPTFNPLKTSQSYFTTSGLPPISSSWRQAPSGSWTEFFFQLNPWGYSPYVTSSLTSGSVCLLWIRFAFIKFTYRTYCMLLKILPFALYTIPLSA
jgi:hypothetical protein